MLWLSDYEACGVIMNSVAIVITIGVMINTSLYRKRKRLDDRLYYLMLITCMIAAVIDGLMYFFLESPIKSKGLAILATFTYSFFIFVFPYLFMLYEDYQCFKDEKRIKKIAVWLGIPTILVVICQFAYSGAILLHVDFVISWDIIAYTIIMLVYVIYLLYLFWRFNKKMLLVFLFSIVGLVIINDVSVPCVFAILLCFAHICAMNEPFYGKEMGEEETAC